MELDEFNLDNVDVPEDEIIPEETVYVFDADADGCGGACVI